MLTAWLVAVGQNGDSGALQRGGVGILPLASPARVARRAQPQADKCQGVLFAFGDIDLLTGGNGFQHVRQAEQDAVDGLHVPQPGAVVLGVGATLPEVFRIESDNLEKQLAVGVGVGVSRHDPPLRVAPGGCSRWEQVGRLQPHRGHDCGKFATCMTP